MNGKKKQTQRTRMRKAGQALERRIAGRGFAHLV